MNETLNCLATRRSVRNYTDKMPADELLDQILAAGLTAPSGMNTQATIMLLVKDAELLKKISKLNAAVAGSTNDPFYGAPAVIVVFADSTVHTFVENGSLVMGNLMNAAHAVGVDSCWIHRAREVFDSEEGRALARKLGVPDNYVGIGNCILGYHADEYPSPKAIRKGRILKA